jgi:hypothetical protein
MDTVKLRMQSFEERPNLLDRSVVNLHEDLALVHVRLDRLDTRVERIERRVDLREEA